MTLLLQAVYRARVDEYKRELARVDETMSALASQYVTGRLKLTARRPRPSAAATAQWASDGPTGDESIDLSEPPSRGGVRLLTAQAAAVKDEADELLEAYAHVLGSGAGGAGDGRDTGATGDSKEHS